MFDNDKLVKQHIALRYWLLGKGYVAAAGAMDWANEYHQGVRKDGVTPEFAHQIAIGSHVRTLVADLRYPEESIITAFCHDVREDYDVADAEVRSRYGDRVADAVDAMTKVFKGVSRNPVLVFDAIATDPIASVVKLADRVHNHSSMVGVFSPAKIETYTLETRTFFIPMMKKARRNFPDQEPIYEGMSLLLSNQLALLDHVFS